MRITDKEALSGVQRGQSLTLHTFHCLRGLDGSCVCKNPSTYGTHPVTELEMASCAYLEYSPPRHSLQALAREYVTELHVHGVTLFASGTS